MLTSISRKVLEVGARAAVRRPRRVPVRPPEPHAGENAREIIVGHWFLALPEQHPDRQWFIVQLVETTCPHDRAHATKRGDLGYAPTHNVPWARPRRYPRSMLVEGVIDGRVERLGPDSQMERCSDRQAWLEREWGVPMGAGLITGATSEIDHHARRVGLRDDIRLRDILEPRTRQKVPPSVKRLHDQATAILRAAEKKP